MLSFLVEKHLAVCLSLCEVNNLLHFVSVEEVTVNSLRFLSENSLIKLVPKRGPRDSLVHHLDVWKKARDQVSK